MTACTERQTPAPDNGTEGEGRKSMTSLLCIGNITIDESVHPDGRRAVAAGGDAVYAALAARLLITDVRISAPIGDDLPDAMLEGLRRTGLPVDDLPRRPLPTVRNVVTYAADGARVWDLVHGETHFDAMSVYPADLSTSDLDVDGVLVSAMSVASMRSLVPWLAAGATRAVRYLDLQEDFLTPGLLDLVKACDVFLPSEYEAVTLGGTPDPVAAARFFATLGPAVVVVKRAERGCLVLDGGTLTEVPAEVVTPVDSTGAGDAFCGAFAAAHLATGDPVDAARKASAAARIAVGDYGTRGLLEALT
jgi:ribokinase